MGSPHARLANRPLPADNDKPNAQRAKGGPKGAAFEISAKSDDEGRALLAAFKFPFRN